MTPREPTESPEPYRGAVIAVGTRHGKTAQFAPAFDRLLGAVLLTPPDLDTDQFGTFTGERPRSGTALQTARAKARLGMRVAGLPYGLASEASYGPLPGSGLPGHEELLIFLDDVRGIEVVEGCRTADVPDAPLRVAAIDELRAGMVAGLPAQALIVRPVGGEPFDVVKGITTAPRLNAAIGAAARRSPDGLALVEPDLRAHHNHGRREVLIRLGETLARRLARHCPRCKAPGFGRIDSEPGLPCAACGSPTPVARAVIHGCPRCPHRERDSVSTAAAEPMWCPRCNP
jgi:hypothetical protein